MYISLNWIRDYVNLDGIDLKKLINQFTLSCAEVEGYEVKGENVSGVITARIEKIENHPNSKKLHLLKVNTGKEILDIVCGAPNVAEGIIVPLATIGANVNGITISKAVVAGYESMGMCCSAKELGFSDDNSGLYVFDEGTPIGVDIKSILDIDDVVFEVDNKSLTNRPDMWGHYGIAREIAAITHRELQPLDVYRDKFGENNLDVQVYTDKCYRYTSATISNISSKVSPINMQIRLYYTGMRDINFLADITNYVMLELGQPMHAFDNDIVKNIQVRELDETTKFQTLDGVERNLPVGTMVIETNNTPVAIAGVMGGMNSEITDNTSSVLVESACFDGAKVRRTALDIGLRTEASARYEKMLDTNLTEIALRRYIKLIKNFDQGAIITSSMADITRYVYPKYDIEITKEYIDRYVGMELSEKTILDILESLEFKVIKVSEGKYIVQVPSYRMTKDIRGKADLVEEITRIFGYDNIVPASTKMDVKPVQQDRIVELDYDVKYALATRYNFSEVHTYIWNDAETNATLGIHPKSVMRIVNSLQKDNDQIRSTIIPSLLKVVMDNKNDYADELSVFEIGRVVANLQENGLVDETASLGMVRASKASYGTILNQLKEAVQYIFSNVVKAKIEFVKTDIEDELICPVNYYKIMSGTTYLGYIGLVNPKVARTIDNKINIAVCELNFTKVAALDEIEYKFERVSKYMGTELDFNFEIPAGMQYSDVERIAYGMQSTLNYKVSLTNIYAREDSDIKNYTLHYSVNAADHTITGEEIETFHTAVIDNFKSHNINLKLS